MQNEIEDFIVSFGFDLESISDSYRDFVMPSDIKDYYFRLTLFNTSGLSVMINSGEFATKTEVTLIRCFYINSVNELKFVLSRIGSFNFKNEQLQIL